MKIHSVALSLMGILCPLTLGARIGQPQEKIVASTIRVHMVITDQAFSDNNEIPALRPENVQVKQGKNVLKVFLSQSHQ